MRVIARLNVGGPAVHTVLLTEGMGGRGYDTTLVTGTVGPTEGDMSYYALRYGVTPVVLAGLGNAARLADNLRALVALFRLLRRTRPHIVHTHTTKAGALGRVAAILYNAVAAVSGSPRAQIVHTFHGHVFAGYFPPWVSRWLVRAERFLARRSDLILTVSGTLKRDLVARYRIAPPAKVHVVPLGFDFGWVHEVPTYTGWLRRALGVGPDVPVVGIVGRLTAIKNHRLLLEAVARMSRRDARVAVVGDGECRAALEEETRRQGLTGRVIFTGWSREPAKIYADLDVVALTSRNEGTPVALIEAMAAARPFVATAVGGVPDLVLGEGRASGGRFEVFANGALVQPDDPDALAAALDFVVERPELRVAMGAVGQAYVSKRFGRERLLDDIEALYGELSGVGGKED